MRTLLLLALLLQAQPPLRVAVTPRMGMAPLSIRVDVRQDVELLRGREVCIHISGPMPIAESCWQTDAPTPLVTRWFRLDEPGQYQVWAGSGKVHSNYVMVEVPMERQQP